jgi:SAM-dependent methyltransferase
VSSPEAYSWLVGFDGDWRDTWWSRDFLALVAARLGLVSARTVVDVGCGVGHWGRLLLPFLHREATLVGVDREASFVSRASAEAERRGLAERAKYVTGVAEAIPLPDASVDLVTCQTLLMHVAEPRVVLAEMLRVLRPGGVLLAAEPNNFSERATTLTAAPGLTRAERLALLGLDATCQDGKRASGSGDSSIGERLPGLLVEAGFAGVFVCQNERCGTLIPPYDGPGQQETVRQMLAWIEGGVSFCTGHTREQAHAWYLAGGGDPAAFEELWGLALREAQAWKKAIVAHEVVGACGPTFYLVSGCRPQL